MKAATIAIPDDLDAKLDKVARERKVSQAEVIQIALRKYLTDIQETPTTVDEDEFRPLRISVIPEKDDHGESDVSINHDYYLAEELLKRKFSQS